jgi:hypothetical protein
MVTSGMPVAALPVATLPVAAALPGKSLAAAARRHNRRTAATGPRYEVPAARACRKIPSAAGAGWCATRHACTAAAAAATADAATATTGRSAHSTAATWCSTASSAVPTLRAGRRRNRSGSQSYRRTDR